MVLKRYIGKDVNEAWMKARMELGTDAVILNTRKIRKKGLKNFFAKPMVEVLVALEENSRFRDNKETANGNSLRNSGKSNIAGSTKNQFNQENIDNQVESVQTTIKEEKINDLENKVHDMQNLILKVYDEIKQMPQKMNITEIAEGETSSLNKLFYKNLLKNDIEAEIVDKLMADVEAKLGSNAGVNDIARLVSSSINEMLGKPQTIKLREDGKPTVVIFIGPTGVGKTTTLAKIAANYTLNHKKKVGMITADTYRIAAVDQLRTYADILNIPVSVVYSPLEVGAAIENFNDKDIILIDTTGRSTSEKEQFEELKTLVAASEANEIYLVLSSTTSISNCKLIINSYDFIENYKLIFTKLDETPVIGVLLNARHYTNKSLSYVTTGQSVPDDIEIADTDKLTKNLLGSLQK